MGSSWKTGFSVTSQGVARVTVLRIYRAAALDPAQLVFAKAVQLVLDEGLG
jgi:hypothetical protein